MPSYCVIIDFRDPSTRRKLLSDPQREGSSRSNLRSQKQIPDQAVSQTTRRRRKALTKALKRIRKKPQRPRRSRRTSLRLSSPLKRSLRTRNPSLPITLAEKEKSKNKNTRRRTLSASFAKMNSIKENRVERVSSPSDASNNSSPSSPESDQRNDGKSSHGSGDSDDDVQMQVLEKQVESDKEEDNDSAPEVSLNLPDDTDEESSLLSPSALPASQVFRSPTVRRKKRKSLTDGFNPHKKLENSNTLLASTPISSAVMPVPFYKLPAMPISPSLNYPHMSHSPSIYTPPPATVASRPSLLSSQGSLPEKRGRGRPRKALADVKSVSGKLYRKKLAERMASSTNDEQRHTQNIYDFHIEHSDEIEPFSYPPLSNPFEDFDPMSAVHHMREFYNYDAGPSSADVPRDPQHMRHRLHRWGDKSTFVYAKHKFVSNENKFKCDVCEVSFTALSSLKRHYGTIYHKQQEAAGRSTLDLSDILRPDRDGNLMEPGPSSGHPFSYCHYHLLWGSFQGCRFPIIMDHMQHN